MMKLSAFYSESRLFVFVSFLSFIFSSRDSQDVHPETCLVLLLCITSILPVFLFPLCLLYHRIPIFLDIISLFHSQPEVERST